MAGDAARFIDDLTTLYVRWRCVVDELLSQQAMRICCNQERGTEK
jgi:hypothetical protein